MIYENPDDGDSHVRECARDRPLTYWHVFWRWEQIDTTSQKSIFRP